MKLTHMQLRKLINEVYGEFKDEHDEKQNEKPVEEPNEEAHSLLYSVAFDPDVEHAMRKLCSAWGDKVADRLREADVWVGSRSKSPLVVVNATRNGLFNEIRAQIVDACESVERKCGL